MQSLLETLSKRAVLLSVVAILCLQGAVHPDITWALRTLVAVAFVAGWVAARGGRALAHATWLFLAPLAPAIVWIATGRQGEPLFDFVWMAGLAGSLLRTVSWSRWSFPPVWSLLLGGWGLALALAWPVIVAREIAFDVTMLRDTNAMNSWAGISAPQVVVWTLYVTGTQLLALLCFDWVYARFADRLGHLPRAVHGLWIGITIASVVAVYQGVVDISWLNTPYWAALQRAGGTMLNPNAYGVAAAFAGVVGFMAVRSWRPGAGALAAAVLAMNWMGTWLSGSRTAVMCAAAGAVGLGVAMWRSGRRTPASLAPVAVAAGLLVITAIVIGGAGPLRRLTDGPIATDGIAALWDRGSYGPIAAQIIREYPLTGVGMGAYHYLAPEYERMATDERLQFDNAQNWWRHQAAELGVLGGALVLAWSALLAWWAMTSRSRSGDAAHAAVARSLVIGLGVTSLVGMPTQDPRVLLFFFFVVAWLAHSAALGWSARATAPWTRSGWTVATVLAIAFAGGHLLLARGDLSVIARAARTGRPYAAGAYALERGPDTPPFHWTDDESRFVWPAQTRWLLISLWAHHPDIAVEPVRVTVSTPCGVLFDQQLTSPDRVHVGVALPEGTNSVDTTVEVSRTWRPSDRAGGDTRTLGAAVAARFLEDAAELELTRFRATWPRCSPAAP